MPVFSDGQRIKEAQWNRLISSIPADYTIAKIGTKTYGESNIAGGTDYEDSNADDLFLYVHDALPTGGTVAVKRANYAKSNTLNLTKNYQTWMFEPGTVITHSGAAEAIKVGSDSVEVKRTKLIGNMARIERGSSGGTYGIHLENAHLCNVDGFYIKNFASAPVLMEGSWSSSVSRVEVEQSYRGTYGIHLRKTQAGTYAGHQNNDVGIHGCWLTGSTSAIYIQDDDATHGSSCMVTINGLNVIHDCPKGIHVDAGHAIVVEHNFFENVDGYHLHLEGSDAEAGNIHFLRNWLHIPAGETAIYADGVSNLTVSGNSVEGGAGSTFIDTPADATNRWIFIYPNRLVAAVTEYAGNTQSLKYHHAAFPGSSDTLTINSAIKFNQSSIFNNNLYLQWKDTGDTTRDILGLGADDHLRVKNPVGAIYLIPKSDEMTLVGLNSSGQIWLGYTSNGGSLPSDIILNPNAATGKIRLQGNVIEPRANIIPDENNLYDIGDLTHQIKDVYVDGKAYIDQLGEDLGLDSKYIDGWNTEAACTEANKGYITIKVGGVVKRVPYYDDA